MQVFQQDFFEHTAERMPTAIAVEDGEFSISYGELDKRANRIGNLLRELGCRPNDRVCIATNKNIGAYAAVLGILKSGACWVPLSLSYPEDRLSRLLKVLAPKAIVAEPATLEAILAARKRADSQAAVITLGSRSAEEHPGQLNELSLQQASTDRPLQAAAARQTSRILSSRQVPPERRRE